MKKPRSFSGSLVEISVIFPLVLVIVSELLNRRSLLGTLEFIFCSPHMFLLNFALMSSMSVLMFAISKRPAVSYLTVGTFGVLIICINFGLIMTREHPMLPTTMFTLIDMFIMCKYSSLFRVCFPLLIIAIIALSVFVLKRTNPRKPVFRKAQRRTLIGLSLSVFIITAALTSALPTDVNAHVQLDKNGYWAGFSQYGLTPYITYDKDAAEPEYERTTGSNQPDVIVIKLESFSWGSEYAELSGGKTVTPFAESLAEQCASGRIMVSPYGGNTCASVFEVLTGYTAAFTIPSTSCYGDMLVFSDNQKSFSRELAESGYQSTYISCFGNEFTNENGAAAAMGFETYIGLDGFPESNALPSKYLSQRIISEYEARDTSRPFLLAGMTMGNHFPFILSDDTEIAYEYTPDDRLNLLENEIMAGYLNGLALDDRMISELIEYFSEAENEVDIIFFSDHRPFLGDTWSVYKKLGYINPDLTPSSMSADDVNFLYGTPYMIWNNKGQIEPDDRRGDAPITAAYLMPKLFAMRDIQGNDVSDFLLEAMKHVDNFGTSSYRLEQYDAQYEQWYRYICHRDIFGNN